MPDELKVRLLKHSLQADDKDKQRRAQKAFGQPELDGDAPRMKREMAQPGGERLCVNDGLWSILAQPKHELRPFLNRSTIHPLLLAGRMLPQRHTGVEVGWLGDSG